MNGELRHGLAAIGAAGALGAVCFMGGVSAFEAGVHDERARHATTEALQEQEIDARNRSLRLGGVIGAVSVLGVGATIATMARRS